MQYELLYLVGVSKEADLPRIKEDIKKIVLDEGGVFAEKETEEKRKLSYAIKHETHGIYIAYRFESEDKEKLQNIIRKINLYQDILRFLISRADELPELRTKEERIREASSEQRPSRPTREISKKPETKKEPAKQEKPEEKKEEEKTDNQDIDKKLEEILNI